MYLPIFLLEVLTLVVKLLLHDKIIRHLHEEQPYEESARRPPSGNQKEQPQRNPTCWHLNLGFFGLQNFSEIWVEYTKEQPAILYCEMDSSAVDDTPICQDQC